MTARDKTGLFPAVRTLEIIDYVTGYLLESFGNGYPFSKINEGIVLVELIDFNLFCVLPTRVPSCRSMWLLRGILGSAHRICTWGACDGS